MRKTLTAEEIREIRGLYGLSQRSFAQLLGIGTASLARYEQGAEPSKANANLIRAARHPEFMLECIERDGDLIPLRQRERATRCVYACISLEPGEAEAIRQAEARAAANDAAGRAKGDRLTMDEVYHYTIQQEVLNEQAANLACEFMEYMIEHNVQADDRTHPVALLLAQLLQLKRSILDASSDSDIEIERIRGHIEYLGKFMADLNASEKVA